MLVLLAGAFIGAAAGFLVLGLVGAILGATVGTMLAAILLLNGE